DADLGADPWGTTGVPADWGIYSTLNDSAYVQGYHGLDSPGDAIGLGAPLGEVAAPSRVALVHSTAAPVLASGDTIDFQFAWRPTGGVFDTSVTGNPQNHILQFGLLRNPPLSGGDEGAIGGVSTPGGIGYSFLA